MAAVYLLDLTRHMTVTPHCLHFTNSRESRQTCMHGHSLTSFMAPPEQRMNQVWKQLRAKWQWPLECVSVFLHASTSGARIRRGSQRSYTLSMGEHYEFNYYVWGYLFVITSVQCIVYGYSVLQVDRYGCGAADRSNPSSTIQRQAATLLNPKWDMPSTSSSWDTAYPDRYYVRFLSLSRKLYR